VGTRPERRGRLYGQVWGSHREPRLTDLLGSPKAVNPGPCGVRKGRMRQVQSNLSKSPGHVLRSQSAQAVTERKADA